MDSGASSGSVIGKSKKLDKTRRSWNANEEEVLIQSLKDVVTKGWKSENGFKAGYLTLLENAMRTAIPGTTLRGNPHINSKIHVWKKAYSTLVTLLSKSGVGWNDSDKTIEATDETWATIVKSDSSLRAMRHKQWVHYHDWCEIFGNDRATGEQSTNFENALQEVLKLDAEVHAETFFADTNTYNLSEPAEDSISDTRTPSSKPTAAPSSKAKKRKHGNDVDTAIVSAIDNLATITKDTMTDLIKQLTKEAEDKLSVAQDKVLNALEDIAELSEAEQVRAAKLLFNNHDNLALFQRLGVRQRICFLKDLLAGE